MFWAYARKILLCHVFGTFRRYHFISINHFHFIVSIVISLFIVIFLFQGIQKHVPGIGFVL